MEILTFKKTQSFILPDGRKKSIPILVPQNQEDIDKLNKFDEKGQYYTIVKQSRKGKYHRQWRAILNFTFDNLPEHYNFGKIEVFYDWLKLQIKFVDTYSIGPDIYQRPRSSSYGSCKEDVFMRELYNPGCDYCCYLLGYEQDEVQSARKKLISDSMKYAGYNYFSNRILIP